MKADSDIQRLLDLHGSRMEIGEGYWLCFNVYEVEENPGQPHGLSYALTMHSPGGRRLLGYDNAHPVSNATGPARKARTPTSFDHRHWRDSVRPYDYQSAERLMEDFWKDVEAMLKEEDVS